MKVAAVKICARYVSNLDVVLPRSAARSNAAEIQLSTEEIVEDAGAVLDSFRNDGLVVLLKNVIVVNRKADGHSRQIAFRRVLHGEISEGAMMGDVGSGTNLSNINDLPCFVILKRQRVYDRG